MTGDRNTSDEARSKDFNGIARDVFAPICPVIARQIVDNLDKFAIHGFTTYPDACYESK